MIDQKQIGNRIILNLGDVVSSEEVYVNGMLAGIKAAPFWKIEITELVRPRENRIEVLVNNTLANYYTTIPSHYGGSTASGLIRPVTIEISDNKIICH